MAYQFLKRKQHIKLPSKEAESEPWDILSVYMIGLYQFLPEGGGKKYQITTKKGKIGFFTGSQDDGSCYQLDRNSYGILSPCEPSI